MRVFQKSVLTAKSAKPAYATYFENAMEVKECSGG
jgi:hypothetical protein